jgi:hypothetical protein
MHIIFLAYSCIATFSLPAFASVPRVYRVETKIFMDGKMTTAPTVVVSEGKTAEISDMETSPAGKKGKKAEGTYLAVTAHSVPNDDKQVFLQMVVGKIKDGKRQIVGTPQLMALENEEAAMEIEENNRQLFKIATVVTRIDEKKTKPAKNK